MLRTSCLIFPFLVVLACSLSKEKQTETDDTLKTQVEQNPEKPFDFSATVLVEGYVDSLYHAFSNDSTSDLFILQMPAGNINGTKTRLCILSTDGKTIYEHQFSTAELINGYDLVDIRTEDQMSQYLLGQAQSILKDAFFDPNNLPEMSFLGQLDEREKGDYPYFFECKKKKRYIFSYGLQEENMFYLGYSDKEGKTVKVVECC
jgi:hypothetical protein